MISMCLVALLTQSGDVVGMGNANDKTASSVYVTIESDAPDVKLVRYLGENRSTFSTGRGTGTLVISYVKDECVAPCNKKVSDPGNIFFIGGESIPSSPTFNLLQHGESLHLKVKGGNSFGVWSAGVLFSLGLASAITGGVILGTDFILSSSSNSSSTRPSFSLAPAGWGLLLGGVGAVGISFPIMSFSQTKVEFFPGLMPKKSSSQDSVTF